MPIDIIPLFESIQDLENASESMETLFQHPAYRKHLKSRNNRQVIMLGYSDGTKDGGYISSNWSIYKAKKALTATARKYQIHLVFFDGRGGPPARGGGNTHKFYSSLGQDIENLEIELTIQGQTISSKFGSNDSAQFNIEQILNAGISNSVFDNKKTKVTVEQAKLFDKLSQISQKAYTDLKDHPKFFEYLQTISPLKYYGETNIASRPTSRNQSKKSTLKALRAIPFVSSCSQIKQNIPAFYGVGTALTQLIESGHEKSLRNLYSECLFFKTLINNSMQALVKSQFNLTSYLKDDPEFHELWSKIFKEYQITVASIKQITQSKNLMHDEPNALKSILLREDMTLPLNIIQQYALQKIRENKSEKDLYKNMIIRTMYGIINASRNSA